MGAGRFRQAVHDVLRADPATERRWLDAALDAGLEHGSSRDLLIAFMTDGGFDEAQVEPLVDALLNVRDRK